jgi:hypothetical protein
MGHGYSPGGVIRHALRMAAKLSLPHTSAALMQIMEGKLLNPYIPSHFLRLSRPTPGNRDAQAHP